MPLARSRPALWGTFVAVHAWLTWLGWVLPSRPFFDLELYRWWVGNGLHSGQWPVLDNDWVYPVLALLPMLAAWALAAVLPVSGPDAYVLGWALLVAALNAVAVVAVLRWLPGRLRAGRRARAAGLPDPTVAVWWWLGLLALLGPVALGRLDAVVAPLVVVALVVATRLPWLSSALLTAGAWIKVYPGAMLLALVAVVRRPLRAAVLPAVAVTVAVVVPVVALGGAGHLASFLSDQGSRGLQLESVPATGWLLAGLASDRVGPDFNQDLNTWEIAGPGVELAVRWLTPLLVLAVAGIGALLWRVRDRVVTDTDRHAVLTRGALLVAVTLIVTNKVGSPQFIGWLAAPVVVALALGLPGWRATAWQVAGIAAVTQVVYPFGYGALVAQQGWVTLLLVARNLALLALLVHTAGALLDDHDDRAELAEAWAAEG